MQAKQKVSLLKAVVPAEAPLVGASPGATLATSLYDRMRSDLLAGKLEPGRKLQIEFLADRYRAGNTPIREALNRLTSDGLVERRDQRGFAAAPATANDLREITQTRCWLEAIALRESLAAKSVQWEEELVLAYHRLSKMPRSHNKEQYEENPEWERLHRAFHRALIAACGSRWLTSFCEQLADQSYRYRQLSVRRIYPKRHELDEHRVIMEAAINGDSDKTIALVTEHYQKTANVILADETAFPELAA